MRSFIESQFPVSRISKESYKERKSNYSQTLTGLGKWWGRKPLVLCRATIIGLLMPASNDPEADRACFLAIMTMDDAGLRQRFKGITPKKRVLELATPAERAAYQELEETWQNAPSPEEKRTRKAELAEAFRELELAVFARLPYDEQIALCDRPEQITGPSPESWEKINAHLGTTASSLPELVAQLGQKRFGHTPRVGDAFCGGGSIPFEAARLGCEAYASDLNPVAALLTWAALNIVGGGPEVAAQVREAQEEVYAAVDRQVCQWGIEHKTEDLPAGTWPKLAAQIASGDLTPAQLDEQIWRADAYLYCVEVRCPETGWLVPLAPSWVIGEKSKAIATLIPEPAEQRYRIEIRSGVSPAEMKAARTGTIQKGKIIHPVLLERGLEPGTLEQARRAAPQVPGQKYHPNGLRLWENDDLIPRPDDVFQERLYCVRWVETYHDAKGNRRTRKHYRSVTPADLEREDQTLTLLRERFHDWQQEGFLPSMELTPEGKTDEPIRTRGWTRWHHIFHPRQLIIYGTALSLSEQLGSVVLRASVVLSISRCLDWSCRLTQWDSSAANEKVSHVFSNHALNTSFSTAWRGWTKLERNWNLKPGNWEKIPTQASPALIDARAVDKEQDIWITDPPYAGAINYHELTEFFLCWQAPRIPKIFPDWYDHSMRALAVTGKEAEFRTAMVECYKRLASKMEANGFQVIMFTHQDSAVWADLALIVWAAGLSVSAAWCVATETDSPHKTDANYVQSTVLLILRKQTSEEVAFLDEIHAEVEDEVKRQLDAMHELDDPHARVSAPDFGDTDYQLAAYAAALRILTRYRAIEDIDVARELARPRQRGAAPSPLENLITEAVKTACDHLVPPGIDRSVWRGLTAAERFYLKGLDLESRGEHRAGAYQELARGFGLKDYSPLLASGRANEVRLHTPTSLGKKHLRGEPGDFATSLLRHTLFAIYEISRQAESGAGTEPGRQWLQKEVPTYWADRKTIIALLRYLARFEQTLETWQHDAPAARLLAGTLENDHEG